MNLEKEILGKTSDGMEIEQFTLSNAQGMKVKVISFGATLTSVQVPDRNGRLAEVTLNLDSVEQYLAGHPCLGSVCGRYANRIAKGKFTLDGQQYTLAVNNGPNHLHGGPKGFDKRVWSSGPAPFDDSVGVTFTYQSADGEEGYPGNLTAKVTYSLTNQNELRMEYVAIADKPTPINLTNHAYWNLAGIDSGSVLNQRLLLNADPISRSMPRRSRWANCGPFKAPRWISPPRSPSARELTRCLAATTTAMSSIIRTRPSWPSQPDSPIQPAAAVWKFTPPSQACSSTRPTG